MRRQTYRVREISWFMLGDTAAPVARIIASVTVGDARLRRDRAPSTMVSGMPHCLKRSICSRSSHVEAAPLNSILPEQTTWAVTSRPSEVRRGSTSRMHDTSRRWL